MADTLLAAVEKLLDAKLFAELGRHGNGRWDFYPLLLVALVWAWTCDSTLTESFHVARVTVAGWLPTAFLGTSYQGFIGALTACGAPLRETVAGTARQAMRTMARRWKLAGWVVIAVDGSKFEVPWTQSNEVGLGMSKPAKQRGRKKRAKKRARPDDKVRPQLFTTVLWHLGLALPWAWKTGPVDSSERGHLGDMLPLLPEGSLLVADAGFTGYDLWSKILGQGHQFLIRIGRNVTLLKKLGWAYERRDNVLHLWPEDQRKDGQPPLVVRLISFTSGKTPVYLATSVLSSKRLTASQAERIYRKRWGIECYFRTVKSTFERRKLRSYTPTHARTELDWSLLGLWLAGLLAAQQFHEAEDAPEPISMTTVLKIVRWHLRFDDRQHPHRPAGFLASLRQATRDTYRRTSSKQCRHDVRQKREKPPGPPKIKTATPALRHTAKVFSTCGAVA